MKRKTPRWLLTAVAACMATAACAQGKTIGRLWTDMPDDVLVYLDKNRRQEHVDYYEMGVTSEVPNRLQEVGVVDTLTSRFMSARLNQSVRMQMKLFTGSSGQDSLLCVVKTFGGQVEESEVAFYDMQWRPRTDVRLPVDLSAADWHLSFLVQPDTMSAVRFDELSRLLDPVMLSASLSPDADELTLRIDSPFLNEKERALLAVIMLQRKFKWENGTLKECK